jgi:hypothetical protein
MTELTTTTTTPENPTVATRRTRHYWCPECFPNLVVPAGAPALCRTVKRRATTQGRLSNLIPPEACVVCVELGWCSTCGWSRW